MFQTVLKNNHTTIQEICNKYNDKLCVLGDKIQSNIKYGTTNKVDKLDFIKIKILTPLLITFEDNINKCNLVIKNKRQLINKLERIIK